MNSLFFRIINLFFFIIISNTFKLEAESVPVENITSENSEFLIESNLQRSDLKNSIFYAEGDVVITNKNKEFIAKSKKAIFYKLIGKIKLLGNVEVSTGEMNKIRAGEVIYYVKEDKFEAISDQNQRVNTKYFFNENDVINNKK